MKPKPTKPERAVEKKEQVETEDDIERARNEGMRDPESTPDTGDSDTPEVGGG